MIVRLHGIVKINVVMKIVMFCDRDLNHKTKLFREVVLIPTCIVTGIGTCSCTGLLWYWWVVYHRTVDSTKPWIFLIPGMPVDL